MLASKCILPVAVVIMIWILSTNVVTECGAARARARYIQVIDATVVIVQRLLFAVIVDRLFHRITAIFAFVGVVGTL